MATTRTTLSLPTEVAQDIAYLARRIGISRSSLIASLLAEPVREMRRLVEAVPEDPSAMTDAEAMRLRGESAKVIQERLEQLQGMAHDLFAK